MFYFLSYLLRMKMTAIDGSLSVVSSLSPTDDSRFPCKTPPWGNF